MKIGTSIMLLTFVAASIAHSTVIQIDQSGAKQKAGITSESSAAVDISKVPLQKGTHEVYRDKASGIIFFRTITNKASYSAVDKNGTPLPLLHIGCTVVCSGPANHVCMKITPTCGTH